MKKRTEHTPRERRTVFVLAGLLLSAIVSIAFYNLDRHPAFLLPSGEFVGDIDDAESSVVVADDPVALAALERHRSDIDAAIAPLTHWPPETTLLSFGRLEPKFERAELHRIADESVWTVWQPSQRTSIPIFAMATVETENEDGERSNCPPDATGARQCGDADWSRVGYRTITVDGDDVECIWAHPLEDRTLRIGFDNVETVGPDGERLVLETALGDEAVGTGVPVHFEVGVGNYSVTHRHQDQRGWRSIRLPATAQPERLVVEVTADDIGRRHSCFRFDAR